ncbi:hypothetical protein [Segatella baroniae]|nr:hypothetical protein [Segatella baroniae]
MENGGVPMAFASGENRRAVVVKSLWKKPLRRLKPSLFLRNGECRWGQL